MPRARQTEPPPHRANTNWVRPAPQLGTGQAGSAAWTPTHQADSGHEQGWETLRNSHLTLPSRQQQWCRQQEALPQLLAGQPAVRESPWKATGDALPTTEASRGGWRT